MSKFLTEKEVLSLIKHAMSRLHVLTEHMFVKGPSPELLEQFQRINMYIAGLKTMYVAFPGEDEGGGGGDNGGTDGGDDDDDTGGPEESEPPDNLEEALESLGIPTGNGRFATARKQVREEVFQQVTPGDYFTFGDSPNIVNTDMNVISATSVWVRKSTCIVCVIDEKSPENIGTAELIKNIPGHLRVIRVDPMWLIQSPVNSKDESGNPVSLDPSKDEEGL